MHILKLSDFSIDQITAFLDSAQEFADGKQVNYQDQKIVANLFFEPSTRTHYSFETAALRLHTSTIDFAAESSSVLKGETLYDTVRTFEAFGVDALVIRHPQNNYFDELKNVIKVPILNGGDGTGNHPSQSLLDLLTIRQEFGHFEGLKCMIVGDIAHSRVAHTNIEVMQRLGMAVYTAGPAIFQEPQFNYVDFNDMLPEVDVVMLLRVQKERLESALSTEDLDEYHAKYGLTLERTTQMKSGAIIMHPAPFNRGVEIADEVVECPASRIYRQVQNGVYVRMALLNEVLGHPDLS